MGNLFVTGFKLLTDIAYSKATIPEEKIIVNFSQKTIAESKKLFYICNARITKSTMKIQESVDYHIRSSLFAMRRMYNLIAAEHGTTQGVAYVLISVPREGVAATRIAPMMGMGATSLSRLLKTMEDDGLIYRVKDLSDKRMVYIHLTEKGVAMRKKVRQVVIDFNNKLMQKLDADEMKSFARVCQLIKKEACSEISRLANGDCNEMI